MLPGWKWYILADSILIAFIDVEKQFLMNWEDFLWFRIADVLGNLFAFRWKAEEEEVPRLIYLLICTQFFMISSKKHNTNLEKNQKNWELWEEMKKKFCVFFDFSSAPALKKPEVDVSELFGADDFEQRLNAQSEIIL